MKLVKDWRNAWRWFSMNCMAISTALLATWASVPEDLKAAIPPSAVMYLAALITAAGMIGRLVDQDAKQGAGDDHNQ